MSAMDTAKSGMIKWKKHLLVMLAVLATAFLLYWLISKRKRNKGQQDIANVVVPAATKLASFLPTSSGAPSTADATAAPPVATTPVTGTTTAAPPAATTPVTGTTTAAPSAATTPVTGTTTAAPPVAQ